MDPLKEALESADPTVGLSDGDIGRLIEDAGLFQRLQDRLIDAPSGVKRLRLLRRIALVTASAVLVVGGTAVAISLLRSPVTNTSQVSCYSQDSLRSNTISEVPYGAHPLASCKAQLMWTAKPSSRAPAGLLCVLPNGSLGGFPPSTKKQSCSSIGLATFNGKLKYPHVLDFQRAAQSFFGTHACPGATLAKRRVLELIGKYGLKGWVIRVYGSRASGACATLAIQPATRVVDLALVDEMAK